MVSALFHYPPTPLVFVYPSFINRSITFCLKSPCTMISPSLAEPPTPHLLFSIFPSSFWSFSVTRPPKLGQNLINNKPTIPILTITILMIFNIFLIIFISLKVLLEHFLFLTLLSNVLYL